MKSPLSKRQFVPPAPTMSNPLPRVSNTPPSILILSMFNLLHLPPTITSKMIFVSYKFKRLSLSNMSSMRISLSVSGTLKAPLKGLMPMWTKSWTLSNKTFPTKHQDLKIPCIVTLRIIPPSTVTPPPLGSVNNVFHKLKWCHVFGQR